MNPRLKKIQDEKAAEVVEKKPRKPRKKKEPIVEIPEPHEHCMQLNCSCTPKPLRDFQYIGESKTNRVAVRYKNNTIVYLVDDIV